MTAPGAPPPVIEFEAVRRIFDDGRVVALDGASLSVEAGERVAIAGRSGSGKSTLLNLAAGLDRPDSGTVRFDGAIPAGRAAWARLRAREIGIVFQGFNLLPTFSALENVALPMLGVEPSGRRRRTVATEWLERLGLGARMGHRPEALSGGERQRVAIARSLVNRPRLLLADEPTGNLDLATGRSVLDLLLSLAAETDMAMVIVTHDSLTAERADRVVTIVDGRVDESASLAARTLGTSAP